MEKFRKVGGNMTEETKICPYCGEEILAVAKKCKHCGEFLDNDNPQKIDDYNDLIAKADVNDKWKERFRAVDFFVVEGKWWKYRPEFWKTSVGERWEMSCKVYGDFGSFIAAFLFGGFYYLFKGMWLKFIVYGIPAILTGGLLWILFPCLAPYDYYRYKVLGKQW